MVCTGGDTKGHMHAYTDLLKIIGKLKADGFCSEVHFKEMYIPKKELQGAADSGSLHVEI